MKLIYTLAERLKNDPEYIKLAQELTLDESRPFLGLKGTNGLFGSDEWWDSIYSRRIEVKFVSGVITRTFYAGMESDRTHNSYELILDDGSLHEQSFYANNDSEKSLYTVGKAVTIAYALDELKNSTYTKTPIEVAISNDPLPMG